MLNVTVFCHLNLQNWWAPKIWFVAFWFQDTLLTNFERIYNKHTLLVNSLMRMMYYLQSQIRKRTYLCSSWFILNQTLNSPFLDIRFYFYDLNTIFLSLNINEVRDRDALCIIYFVMSIFQSVNGGWGSWYEWGSCLTTTSCGGGLKIRTRDCDNPAPMYGGSNCSHSSLGFTTCNTNRCPGNKTVLHISVYKYKYSQCFN